MGQGSSQDRDGCGHEEGDDVVYKVGGGYERYFQAYKNAATGDWALRATRPLNASDWKDGSSVVLHQYRNGQELRQCRILIQVAKATPEPTLASLWPLILLALLFVLLLGFLSCVLFCRRRSKMLFILRHWPTEKTDCAKKPPYAVASESALNDTTPPLSFTDSQDW